MLKSNSEGHVHDDVLGWSVRGILNNQEKQDLSEHLGNCHLCQQRLEYIRQLILECDLSKLRPVFLTDRRPKPVLAN